MTRAATEVVELTCVRAEDTQCGLRCPSAQLADTTKRRALGFACAMLIMAECVSAAAADQQPEDKMPSEREIKQIFKVSEKVFKEAEKKRSAIREAFSLKARVDQPLFLGEPFIVNVELANKTQHPAQVPDSFRRDVRFRRPRWLSGEIVRFEDDAIDFDIRLHEGGRRGVDMAERVVAFVPRGKPATDDVAYLRDMPKSLDELQGLKRVIHLYCPDPFGSGEYQFVVQVPPLDDIEHTVELISPTPVANTVVLHEKNGLKFLAWVTRYKGRSYLFAKALPLKMLDAYLSLASVPMKRSSDTELFFFQSTEAKTGEIAGDKGQRGDPAPGAAEDAGKPANGEQERMSLGIYNRRVYATRDRIEIRAMSANSEYGAMVIYFATNKDPERQRFLALVHPFTGEIQLKELERATRVEVASAQMDVGWGDKENNVVRVSFRGKGDGPSVMFDRSVVEKRINCSWRVESVDVNQ